MASNQFYIKGWAIALLTGLFAIWVKDPSKTYVNLEYFLISIFWILEGYFLTQERLFRDLYDHVRRLKEKEVDFSMNTQVYTEKARNTLVYALFSKPLFLFYLALIVMVWIISF